MYINHLRTHIYVLIKTIKKNLNNLLDIYDLKVHSNFDIFEIKTFLRGMVMILVKFFSPFLMFTLPQ